VSPGSDGGEERPQAHQPRIPAPRPAAEDGDWPPPAPIPAPAPAKPEPEPRHEPAEPVPDLPHSVLKSLLGAWALSACSAAETAAVEAHLTDCGPCAEEALRLRDAVGLLHPQGGLDLDPSLRSQVIGSCLARRPAHTAIPGWASPYDAETARFDALLRDMADAEWRAEVRLRWFDGERIVSRPTTVEDVLGHLLAVDGLVASAVGLPDPLGEDAAAGALDPTARTTAYWRTTPPEEADGAPRRARGRWREQSRALVRTLSTGGPRAARLPVSYGRCSMPVRAAMLERAFECWVHAGDVAEAVDYPHPPPEGPHLRQMIALSARMLPETIAVMRASGAIPATAPGRAVRLEIEGPGGGTWHVPLDASVAAHPPAETVAHVALEEAEFCRLAAGHITPMDAAAGQHGDRQAVWDVLFAAASMSRL
jgi:mycothiol maleylpyruvate isomerase-like protein/putative zinc finger protein